MLARQGVPAARIAEVIGVSRATLYRHVDVGALREGSPENGRV
jgi:predicted site-specific integrase-resolvase